MKTRLLRRLRKKVECDIIERDEFMSTYCIIRLEYRGYYFSRSNVLVSQSRKKANELILEAAIHLHREELRPTRKIYLFKHNQLTTK